MRKSCQSPTVAIIYRAPERRLYLTSHKTTKEDPSCDATNLEEYRASLYKVVSNQGIHAYKFILVVKNNKQRLYMVMDLDIVPNKWSKSNPPWYSLCFLFFLGYFIVCGVMNKGGYIG